MKTKNIIKKMFLCAIFIFIGIITTHPDTVSGSGGSGSVHYHSWTSATCTSPARCTSCGATSGSALGHSMYVYGYRFFNVLVTARDQYLNPMSYSGYHYKLRRCSRCGYEGAKIGEECSMSSSYTAPTCTSAGYSSCVCSKCGGGTSNSLPALGHDWTWWSTNENGHWYTCRRCGATSNYGDHWDSNCNGYCNTCGYQMFILVNKPVLNVTSFIYNGLSQSPTFRSFDTSHVNISGNSAIDAGTYTATISLKNTAKYKWADEYRPSNRNANGSYTFQWVINKKHIQVIWNNVQVFECDKTKDQMRQATAPTGVAGETMNLTLTVWKRWVGEYPAHAEMRSVTGGRQKISNYVLENTESIFRIIDTTRPVITVTQNYDDWTNQNVIFNVTANDSGMGVKRMEYSLDTLSWRTDFDSGYTATQAKKTFTNDQNNVIYFRAIDEVGNISNIVGPLNIRIDKTPPTITTEKNPERDWTNLGVDLKVIANDNFAVKDIKIDNVVQTNVVTLGATNQGTPDELVTSMETTKHYDANKTGIVIVVSDRAGNTATKTVDITNIDKTKPTITVPGEASGVVKKNIQQFVLKDDVAPNSKMRFVAVSKTTTAPVVFGDGSVTEGNLLDYYYQVANDATVNFTYKFSEEGNYTIFARDLAGNVQTKTLTVEYDSIESDTIVEFDYEITGGASGQYVYDGLAHCPKETVKNSTTNAVLVKDVDYTMTVANNINAGTATITITGIGDYKGTKTFNFEIVKRALNIVPDSGQSKLRLVNDPVFTFTYSNQVVGEVPAFSGALSRDSGEAVGLYNITLGTLALIDNAKFLANNYRIEFTENVKFEIGDFDGLITTWRVPANGKVTLPIPGYASNNYRVSWGDGNYEEFTMQGFPTHTYNNTSQTDYTIIVAGDVKIFGYINELKPTATNVAKDYVTFNDYLIAINNFGDVNAARIGFSYCSNLVGNLPTGSGFETLTSVENMFNECTKLTGPIPANFFKDVTTIESARNVFNNCIALTGSLDSTVFSGCTGVLSFENAFRSCRSITGAIPAEMFTTNTKVQNFAGVFANMTGITGEIPEGLFTNNAVVRSFSEAFANDAGLTKIPESLFETNKLATNYYHAFYHDTGITVVPTYLFINNVVGTISNEPGAARDYRGAFEGCTGLTFIDLDVLLIGKEMFKDCTAITKIVLPHAVELGESAFYGCNSLTHIKISKQNLAVLGEDAFEYTGPNPPLLTYINKQNSLLLDYDWPADNRIIDTNAPKGTVQIVKDTYPFTNTEEVQLQITLEDDISDPSNCYIAILNDTAYKEFTPEEIANAASANESLEVFTWEPYVENKTWTLTAGDEVKTVYVYFKDEMGNISFVTEMLDLVTQEYTITYKTSDSSVQNMPQAQSAPMDQDITITNQKPTKPNRGFIGWAKTENSTNVDYRPGDVYVDGTSIVLYPVWVDGFNMIYYPNGGANAPSSDRKQVGEPYTISSQVPTREGYDFQGWARTSTATVAEYQPGDQYTIDENTIFWAVWKVKKYQITFNANGGVQSSCPTGFEKTYAINVLLSKTIPVRDGYIFEGWARDNPNATSPNYSVAAIQNESVMFAENYSCVLYAVWRVGEYNVFFNANGGSNAPSSGRKIGGQPYIIPSQQPTKWDKNFGGWATSSTATVAEYQPGDQYTRNEEVTFYAVWVN